MKYKKGDILRVLDVEGWEGSEVEVLRIDDNEEINPYYCKDINDGMGIYLSEDNLENL